MLVRCREDALTSTVRKVKIYSLDALDEIDSERRFLATNDWKQNPDFDRNLGGFETKKREQTRMTALQVGA